MSARGFTLIELIVVMMLMAILASFAMPRFFGRGDFEGPAFAHELAAAARYAQKLAITGGCPVHLAMTASGYQLLQPQNAPAPACDGTFTRDVLNPGTGGAFAGPTPAGVSIGGTPLTVEFKASGVPFVGGIEAPADVVIPVGDKSVRIATRSGYVEVVTP